MNQFLQKGEALRLEFKNLIYDFMKVFCSASGDGLSQAEIFRKCGMDWGDYDKATSTNQQYWLVALLRELEKENKIQRNNDTKKWRLI